jgi:protein-S-isoprenylcysteine O-methyltransferase Ste14
VIDPAASELLVRGTALYLPIVLVAVLALHARPDRRRVAGTLLATAWNLPALLALNLVAVHAGWWTFGSSSAAVAGVPADLWVGWALLWGAVPLLATTSRLVLAGIVLVTFDLVLMPLAEPVVDLGPHWLLGEALAAATCLVPGLLLGRWTAEDHHVGRRVVLQVIGFAGLVFFVVPSLVFEATGGSWAPLPARPRWHFLMAGFLLAPVGAMALQAVRAFSAHGGTPVPLDPPKALVTTGPYAYVANPMQLAGSLLLAGWGILLGSLAVVAAAAVAAAFSAGLAAWSEDRDLVERFGDGWRGYRRAVRVWWPRWRPAVSEPATVYVAATCRPCSEVGRFLAGRHPLGLDVRPAETCPFPLARITYVQGSSQATGIGAIGRSLEHANLAWAVLSWMGRLPGVEQLLLLISDVVIGRPGAIPHTGVDDGARPLSGAAGTGPGCSR